MDSLREYLISVVAAALICSILLGWVQSGFAKELIKLLCGIFLSITIIRPITNIEWDSLMDYSLSFSREAKAAASIGEKMASNSLAEIIKEESEAYILDKAAALHADITVDITLNQENIPVSAVISGPISPNSRECIERILDTDLGITKENQVWTG